MLEIGNAAIYYEIAGSGQPIVFIHAGVADSRQWNNEFHHFSKSLSVARYDMRGFGKSEPADGEFTHLDDLATLLKHLNFDQPAILVGCSMGGSTALDFALDYPKKVKALADANPETEWVYQYSPESFTGTELDFAVEVVDAVTNIWQPKRELGFR